MIKTNEIKGLIVKNGLTQTDVALKLNMSPKTFGKKLKVGKFNTDEMYSLIKILDIRNPSEIFFANL